MHFWKIPNYTVKKHLAYEIQCVPRGGFALRSGAGAACSNLNSNMRHWRLTSKGSLFLGYTVLSQGKFGRVKEAEY